MIIFNKTEVDRGVKKGTSKYIGKTQVHFVFPPNRNPDRTYLGVYECGLEWDITKGEAESLLRKEWAMHLEAHGYVKFASPELLDAAGRPKEQVEKAESFFGRKAWG